MPSNAERKEAIRKFKERKPALGTYGVRCIATGQAWVGASRNLAATRNSAWFSLRIGRYPEKSLQTAWDANGEAAFEYTILEQLDDDVMPLAVVDLLKEKRDIWIARLGACGVGLACKL